MNRQDVLVIVSVLTTLADAAATPAKGLPSGHLYSVLTRVTDLGHYQAVLAMLKSAGFVEDRGHFLTATEKGIALGKELEEELERSNVTKRKHVHVRVAIHVEKRGRLVWVPESEWTFFVDNVDGLVNAVRDVVRSKNSFRKEERGSDDDEV